MSLASKLLSSAGGGVDKLFSDDVFQAFTRTGTGADVTVTTGIDMTKGYMLWSKGRSGATDHAIYDSARGVTFDLTSNTTAAQTTQATGLKSVSATGHTIGSLGKMNTSGATYVDFVIRKAPKFFDVVTYTGNGASSRAISHLLGQEVGMVMTKATSTAGDWNTYHRSATGDLVLNSTAAQTGSKALVNSATTSTFTVSGAANTNAVTYVAYLFAHDPSADGIIQCGGYVGNGAATGPAVTLGWEPQYLLIKNITTGNGGGWSIMDIYRSLTTAKVTVLLANTTDSEAATTNLPMAGINAVGFSILDPTIRVNETGSTYIYMAIRRPNKPPTTGTEVYNAIARTGTGATATVTGVGFAPDLVVSSSRTTNNDHHAFVDRLRGATRASFSTLTKAEVALTQSITNFTMDGCELGDGTDGIVNGVRTYINHFFKRAVGVFDVACYTGTGTGTPKPHNLSVAPELVITKRRDATRDWYVYLPNAANSAQSSALVLNSTAARIYPVTYSATTTAVDPETDTVGSTNVMYLFASKPGISKVGSYTGNGTSQTIDCGFTTGARFVMIRRTDSTGDWYVWDTVRGLVSGNDPHLSLNSTTAEITTDDSLDPASVGFIVNQFAATDINVTSASYIYLSFA